MDVKILKGMLLGLATGDALGVPVEFESRLTLRGEPVENMRAFGSWNQPAGTWSDDTSLTIAAMESITRCGKIDFQDIMENFLRWYERGDFTATGERFDIGTTTRSAIVRFSRKLLSPIKCGATEETSNGNGSLMRILPATLYLYGTRGQIGDDELKIIHEFSALTHGHIISCMACGIYSLIATQILNGKNISEAVALGMDAAKKFYGTNDVFKNFSRLCNENFAALPENEISSSGYVVDTLEAALWCLLNTVDYKTLALKAVNLGGDTDTTAAVAGGLAGIFYGAESIPAEWLSTLKRRDYLEKICANFATAC
ncbi:MAG: ADP-ribosylglycohydrolase family protein [Selenomonadaceae bacterium]|nr:ADP-ribosylglycohydrolase family protein [Selenomonadaceae bacterium]MBQ6131671.1 ADP-ribosylglycohydrolase family protein [Selenomonadaceae bacterium]